MIQQSGDWGETLWIKSKKNWQAIICNLTLTCVIYKNIIYFLEVKVYAHNYFFFICFYLWGATFLECLPNNPHISWFWWQLQLWHCCLAHPVYTGPTNCNLIIKVIKDGLLYFLCGPIINRKNISLLISWTAEDSSQETGTYLICYYKSRCWSLNWLKDESLLSVSQRLIQQHSMKKLKLIKPWLK